MPSTTSSVRLFAVVLLSLAAVGTVSSTTIITNTSQTCLDYLLATQSLLKVAKNAGVLTTFFNQLSSSSVTGISPSSKTISGIAPQLLNDPTYAENLLNLHIFPNANFSGFSSSGSDTVLTSALNIPSTVNHTYELLGQYGGQRVKFYQNSTDGNLYVQSGIQYAVVNSTFIGSNGVIHNIGPILYPPGNDTTILTALNAASTSNGNPVSVFLSNYLSYVRSAINGTQGYTLYVPTDVALTAFLTNYNITDSANITAIIQNHVVPTLAYTTNVTSNMAIMSLNQTSSLNNSSLTLYNNMTSGTLQVYGATSYQYLGKTINIPSANIINPDITFESGVIHVIDAVLFSSSYRFLEVAGYTPPVYTTTTTTTATTTTTTTTATPTTDSSANSKNSAVLSRKPHAWSSWSTLLTLAAVIAIAL